MNSLFAMNNNNTSYSSDFKLNSNSHSDSKHDNSKMSQAGTTRSTRRRASKSSYFGHRAKQPSSSSITSSSDKSEYNWPYNGEDGSTGQTQSSDFANPASENTPSQQMLLREIGAALTL